MIRTADPLENELTWCLESARPPKLRSVLAWAEDEVLLPDGPHQGLRFKADRQPWTKCLLTELDNPHWLEHYITGPSQSGKTLCGFCIPAMYYTCELRETYGVGLPDMLMADNKWQIDLRPVFTASPRLRDLLPTRGPGSKNGAVKDSITLANGAVLKFFTPGGDDTTKAGFTTRALGITEAARFSAQTSTSVEADPLRQLKARLRSFSRERRRVHVEGTLSIAEELPWSAKETTSQSRLEVPCAHCEKHFEPVRDHLVGWQNVETEWEAMDKSRWYCPHCGQAISEDERRDMNRQVRLVHEGQRVDKAGRVYGDLPQVRRLWFHYRAFHNQFGSTADIAAEEWNAEQLDKETQEGQNAEKALCQFIHSEVYTPPELSDVDLDDKKVRQRHGALPRGLLPAETKHLTIGIDVGKWTSWWLAIAWTGNRLHVPAYGALDVVTNDNPEDVEVRLLAALREFRDSTVLNGWAVEGTGEVRIADMVWIDAGYMPDIVFQFCREELSLRRFLPAIGRGSSQLQKYKYTHPSRKTSDVKAIGNQWHLRRNHGRNGWEVTFDADHWKKYVQERLSTPLGKPGAMSFYAGTSMEHTKLAKHLTSEKLERTFEPGKGYIETWVKSGANHWLDCSSMACGAGDFVGFDLTPEKRKDRPKPPPPPAPDPGPLALHDRPFISRRD